jgi:hypothetical protein
VVGNAQYVAFARYNVFPFSVLTEGNREPSLRISTCATGSNIKVIRFIVLSMMLRTERNIDILLRKVDHIEQMVQEGGRGGGDQPPKGTNNYNMANNNPAQRGGDGGNNQNQQNNNENNNDNNGGHGNNGNQTSDTNRDPSNALKLPKFGTFADTTNLYIDDSLQQELDISFDLRIELNRESGILEPLFKSTIVLCWPRVCSRIPL